MKNNCLTLKKTFSEMINNKCFLKGKSKIRKDKTNSINNL